jgi:hypothetical protein
MNSPNHSLPSFFGYIFAMLCAFLLAACGGGGGSAGTVPNQPTTTPTPTANVRSLTITTSGDSLPSSGVAGSEVIVTVLARDAGNNAVTGATITLAASSGALTFILPSSGGGTGTTPTPGVTDANGMVMAKLSIGGDHSVRDITLSASSGSVTVSRTSPPIKVTPSNPTITLTPSSTTLQSSGEVKVTALVLDGNNNAINNAIVNFTAPTGAIVLENGNKTNSSGMVTATLNAANNATLRDITVTASLDQSSGIATPATTKVSVVVAKPTLQLTASSGFLGSSGAAGTEVVLTVLARDANNNVVPGLKINLSADSGALSVTGDQKTNAQGTITEKLGTAGNPADRTIEVTATATGAEPAKARILVNGTRITINSSSTVNAGVPTTLNVSLVDSSNAPLINRLLEVKALNGGLLTVKGGGPAVTSISGQLVLEYTAGPTQTSERITVNGLGADTAVQDLVVNNNVFSVKGTTQSTGNINTCYPIIASSNVAGVPSVGQLAFSTSRGAIFSDAACQVPLNSSVSLRSDGTAPAFIKGTSPGVATLVATLTPTNGAVASARGEFEFVAPLGNAPKITLQSDPAVVTANQTGSSAQTATLLAVVRDAQNNAVKGAIVNFSLATDPSGGSIGQPSVVTTGADGVASTTYISGTTSTATDGVTVQAQIQGTGVKTTAGLTVANRALFITAGTGAVLDTSVSTETYVQRFQVLVSDAAGQAVPGVTVTASAIPSGYGKGQLVFNTTSNIWAVDSASYHGCANEDTNHNGILDLDLGEDFNNNGRLEPGIPVAITISGKTDSNGTATIAMRYARNLANWLTIDLTISAIVAGSEARYTAHETLFGVAEDFNKGSVLPPGRFSPYGVNPCQIPL